MSDNESSRDGTEEVILYRCRYCPNEAFTAAERNIHRRQHKDDKRIRSENSEIVTLFHPMTEEVSVNNRPDKSTRSETQSDISTNSAASSSSKPRRIRSNKVHGKVNTNDKARNKGG